MIDRIYDKGQTSLLLVLQSWKGKQDFRSFDRSQKSILLRRIKALNYKKLGGPGSAGEEVMRLFYWM